MEKFNFVRANDLKTLGDYGASLLTGLASLKTLERFHVVAYQAGLLDADEQETGKTICWEIQRLISLYQTQMKHILERTNINEQEIVDKLQALMPALKLPKKKGKKNE